jgi:hypothetical protein
MIVIAMSTSDKWGLAAGILIGGPLGLGGVIGAFVFRKTGRFGRRPRCEICSQPLYKIEELPPEVDRKLIGELTVPHNQQLWVCAIDRSYRGVKIGRFTQLLKNPISASWKISRDR